MVKSNAALQQTGRQPFRNRREAGRLLAPLLKRFAGGRDVVVLALPRGGVPDRT